MAKALEFEAWLAARGYRVLMKESAPPGRDISETITDHAPEGLFCVFVLGGDGTFLSAVHWIGKLSTPVHGIKFGEVGFLAETSENELYDAAEKILQGEYYTRQRMRILVEVERGGDIRARETVLNDMVINKGTLARLAAMETWIDGLYLTTFRADGLILSTPTGSTAYSLAAGGPVVHPAVEGIILTPICPFTLTNRPLIVPDSSEITIRLSKDSEDILLTFDGQLGIDIDLEDTIRVRKSPHPVNMISLPERSYFEILKTKLSWSGGRG